MPYKEKDCRKLYVTEFFFFWKILVTWGRPDAEAEPRPAVRGSPCPQGLAAPGAVFSCVRTPCPAALRPAGGGTLVPAGPTQHSGTR